MNFTRAKKFSPAARILCSLIFAVPVSVLPNISAATLALVLSFSVLPFFSPQLKPFLKRALQINIFILFIWLLTPWTTPGESVWGPVTREGLELCLLVTIKANSLFIIFYTLVSSLSFSEVAGGCKKLGFPDKLVAMMLFCARGISVFETEYTHMSEAAKLRGFSMKADQRTYRTVAAMISVLFARAFRRSCILDEAMKLRGFNGRVRTLRNQSIEGADFALIGSFVSFSLIFGVVGWL